MNYLMITWTDIFEGIGSFFEWSFKGMRALGQLPNVLIGAFIIGMLAFWCLRIIKYKKVASKENSIE